MTFRRVLNRNGLADGDYQKLPTNHAHHAELLKYEPQVGWGQSSPRTDFGGFLSMLSGDLRRLERDATDEGAICKYIAQKTGVDADTVAAVLKEFLAW